MKSPQRKPDAPLLKLSEYLPYHLTVTANAVSNLIGGAYHARFAISVWQWRVLCTLGAEGPMTAQDIVKLSAMDKVTVSRAIQGLRKRGLVHRVKSKADARAFDLHLTTQGQIAYREIAPVALSYQEQVLEGLSASERRNLMSLLEKISTRARTLLDED
ncbi:MAG: winged helix-turn-helix transcriptional regulator [Hyphomonadaceae bacterium]|nr:MAG: MarR family transcriptional regulator [Caulobacteraceae bacterium]MBT9447527.1 winged helix-turn-helix transcriptional regulator [Hyphomonadaceae bacterium]TPW05482.1 MAG: MarR family transcriptional regulator [Alphaproteobacteria bacterium]